MIDDYAHHPTEIKAIHQAVEEMYPREKYLVIFQPHLFTRTQDFAEEFAKALSKFDDVKILERFIQHVNYLFKESIQSGYYQKLTTKTKA